MAKGSTPKVGVGYKRIYSKDGSTIGYLKGKNIYDSDLNLWGTLPSKKISSQYIIDNAAGSKALGYFDSNNNLFGANGAYIGTVRKTHRVLVALPIVLLMLVIVGVSAYFSSFLMGKIGVDTFDPKFPVIELTQTSVSGGNAPWAQLERLDILNSTAGSQIILPGAIGNYSFVMDNKNESNITIDFVITDKNEKAIPMRYRLKMSNVYIVGTEKKWATIADMSVKEVIIPTASKAMFTLEWMWDTSVSDEHDTNIGNDFTTTYTMDIKIDAEMSAKK